MQIAVLALTGAAALVLAGCTPTPHPIATSKPSATPVFASDAAALEAAEKTYRNYLMTSDQVLADGGQGVERLRNVATGRALEDERAGASKYRSQNWRSVGTTTVSNISLERRSAGPLNAVVIYACNDVSAVDVVDGSGDSVVSVSRPNLSPVEVSLDAEKSGKLLVSQVNAWPGGGVC